MKTRRPQSELAKDIFSEIDWGHDAIWYLKLSAKAMLELPTMSSKRPSHPPGEPVKAGDTIAER